jgi:hypothetical protein
VSDFINFHHFTSVSSETPSSAGQPLLRLFGRLQRLQSTRLRLVLTNLDVMFIQAIHLPFTLHTPFMLSDFNPSKD